MKFIHFLVLKMPRNYSEEEKQELLDQFKVSGKSKTGRIPLTNSLAERAIRPFAIHRKNWLYI